MTGMDSTSRPDYLDALLLGHLRAFFPGMPEDAIARFRAHLQWMDIRAGETLLQQGDPGDALYLLVSGRLRAYLTDEDGVQRVLREVPRGEIVGEISLYTGEPRTATVVAVRDSVLARLDKAGFEQLMTESGQLSIALTRQIVRRLRTEAAGPPSTRPVTIGLVPITDGIDLPGFARSLGEQLARHGRVRIVDAAAIAQALPGAAGGQPAPSGAPGGQPAGDGAALTQRIGRVLDEIEAAHDFVLLVADDTASEWTRLCTRHSDEMLLLADAQAEPRIHPSEARFLEGLPARSEAAEILVLLHPSDARAPRHTARWLARRPVADHVHIRPGLARDMARLARVQSRTAVGLVLAGGGARGLAHMGVYRALLERGIPIDYVGGTSIGAVMGLYVASDQPYAVVDENARRSFGTNPTGDFNLLPVLSLIKGQRLRRVVESSVRALFGFDAHLEDLWLNYFCVATNYSRASEQVMRDGAIGRALLASVAIPGALPPVLHDGDLLCDGGTFNNFPVDVMARARGVGKVIGVDLSNVRTRRIPLDEVPAPWSIFLDRLRGRSRRRYRLPSLASYLMNVTILYSVSRRAQAQAKTDLYFNPPLLRVGMLQWRRYDKIVAMGHAHAREVLDAMPPDDLAAFHAPAEPPGTGPAPASSSV